MFSSQRNNEPPPEPEDIQELINKSDNRPNCEPSSTAVSRDTESGARGGSGAGRSVPSSSTACDQPAMRVVHTEEPAEDQPRPGPGLFWGDKCLSVPFLLLLGVTASLVVLPLVLPPLPPPPSMLLLVPVAMLLVLLALAFMPTSSGGRGGTSPTTHL